jgi:heptosyltransferase-1
MSSCNHSRKNREFIMRVLIIKISSLGDIIHTLPALTDAGKAISDISFDWVVEESFAEIPAWHPLVDSVIPVALRRWRKNPLRALYNKEWRKFYRQLKAKQYDMVIDAQGLIKSAILCRMARGLRVGLDKQSLTEPLARFAYQKTVTVDLQKHAIYRMRNIFAQALQYPIASTNPDYGISITQFNNRNHSINILNKEINNYFVFLHGTT